MSMASDTKTAEGLSVTDAKRLLASKGVDYSACLERSELVVLAESHGLLSGHSEVPETAQAPPIARDSASDISPDAPLDRGGVPVEIPEAVAGAEPSTTAQPPRSIGELKALLELHGIDHSRCLYRADLEALARGLPVSGASAATASAAPPRTAGGGKRKGGGSGSVSVEALAALDGPPLFAALRTIADVAERRRVTARVHAVKMALWRLKPTFRGMPQHLTEEVHPMFRSGFQQVCGGDARVLSPFSSPRTSLLALSYPSRSSERARSAGASSSRPSRRRTGASTGTMATRTARGSPRSGAPVRASPAPYPCCLPHAHFSHAGASTPSCGATWTSSRPTTAPSSPWRPVSPRRAH